MATKKYDVQVIRVFQYRGKKYATTTGLIRELSGQMALNLFGHYQSGGRHVDRLGPVPRNAASPTFAADIRAYYVNRNRVYRVLRAKAMRRIKVVIESKYYKGP